MGYGCPISIPDRHFWYVHPRGRADWGIHLLEAMSGAMTFCYVRHSKSFGIAAAIELPVCSDISVMVYTMVLITTATSTLLILYKTWCVNIIVKFKFVS